MDRATRDKFASGTQADVTSGNACWETPPEVFAQLDRDFGPFDVDLTADRQRRLCHSYFGPDHVYAEYRDALTADWLVCGHHGYSNPPYGPFVQKMLRKASIEATKGFTSTLLLPMRVTVAFKEVIIPQASELLFCDSRIVFHENGQPRWNQKILREKGLYVGDSAMFDSVIVRFMPQRRTLHVAIWDVPEHGKWKPEYAHSQACLDRSMEPAATTAASEAQK